MGWKSRCGGMQGNATLSGAKRETLQSIGRNSLGLKGNQKNTWGKLPIKRKRRFAKALQDESRGDRCQSKKMCERGGKKKNLSTLFFKKEQKRMKTRKSHREYVKKGRTFGETVVRKREKKQSGEDLQ